jgi:hypothetical protein
MGYGRGDPLWADRPIARRARRCEGEHVPREFLFFAIVALILVEVTHLKWIWWNYWVCRKHARVHKECGCSKWVLYL